jgi:hypothetical protein
MARSEIFSVRRLDTLKYNKSWEYLSLVNPNAEGNSFNLNVFQLRNSGKSYEFLVFGGFKTSCTTQTTYLFKTSLIDFASSSVCLLENKEGPVKLAEGDTFFIGL